MLMKRIFTLAISAMLVGVGTADAQSGKGGGSSGSSSGSSGGGRSSFSGGNSGRSSFSNPPAPPKSPSFSGGSGNTSKPGSAFSGGSSSSGKPSSSFSGGSSSGSSKVTSSTPIAGKTPTSVSTKPAASKFDSLAGKDAKKTESRTAYEASKTPAPTYKTPAGKEVKIDPKDKQIENLRGRLDEQRWVNRNSRENTFYHSYSGRPIVVYNDCYHPMWNYWLLSQSINTMSLWCYHHQASMDQARLNEMYAQNAGLRAKVAALEAQKMARDPTYMPPNVDPDLAYNDAYVNAAYNPHPKTVTTYEYDHSGPGIWTVLLWIFVYIPLTIVAILAVYFFIFVYRW